MNIIILLTGTIKVNTNFVEVIDWKIRREEYLKAIKYYTNFGTVVFLENSSYDVENDEEFKKIKNLIIYKMKPSKYFDRGKGYQEFEMIDTFVKDYRYKYNGFIKVTGRYIIEDFKKIMDEISKEKTSDMIIDVSKKYKQAWTYLFFVKRNFYKNYLLNLYKNANDLKGKYIEHVIYDNIMENKHKYKFRMFFNECNIIGKSGSTGVKYTKRSNIKLFLKSYIRKLSYNLLKIKVLYW